jgi:predicted nucleic acid-binding protein
MPDQVVVDASFAFRLLAPSPTITPFQEQARRWAQEGTEWVAPTLWLYEMTSALCKAVRLGELAPAEGEQALALTHHLGVRLIPPNEVLARSAFAWTLRLNRAAAYDSFYLALAETLGCELWTADRRLSNAVGLPWVRCVDGRQHKP